MGGRYKIDCLEWNPQHVRFNVFDPFGANCGVLTILAKDVKNFVTHSWKGDIFWNGKMPQDFIMGDAMEIITALVRGIELWASDEDGVHEGCWEAYQKAKFYIGEI